MMEIAVDLSEDVIREILLRLPVKPLLKFRCVSKSWLSLISTHQFALAHLNVSSKKNDTLIFVSNDLLTEKVKKLYTCSVSELSSDIVYSVQYENPVVDYVELDSPFTGINGFRWIVGSCNGLVCLLFSGDDIILWNPALKKFKKLPYSGAEGFSHGFGYDKVHDDYKVVVLSKGWNNIYQVKVYSMRSNSWKVLSNWPSRNASSWPSPGQFLNGAIHWSVLDQGWIIVAQDVVSDEFVNLPLPPNFQSSSDVLVQVKVEILDGCLALCCWYNTYMDMWVMKEYGLGESWIKQACIPHSPRFYRPEPILLFGDGKILIKYIWDDFKNV